jgi:hypothetical protein
MTQSFLEELAGRFVRLELRQEDQRLGPPRTDLLLTQQLGRKRPRAGPLAGRLMRACSVECPATAVVLGVRRCQPDGMLGELGSDGRRAAILRKFHRLVERYGDLGVRLVLRQREMTGANEWLVGDLRDLRVNDPPPLPEILVEH